MPAAAYRSSHRVWRVAGRDPLGLLEATTSQSLEGLEVGDSRIACILDEHGRILSFVRVTPLDDATVLLDGEPPSEAGTSWLSSISPLSGCTIAADDTLAVVAVRAHGEPDRATVAMLETVAIARITPIDGLPGADLIVPAEHANVLPSGELLEPERIAHGWPRFGLDVTDAHLLNETPFLPIAASFTKGCYRGQETVAKIRNLGQARRAIVRVISEGSVAVGATVVRADAPIGTVSSAADRVGIATVRREHADAHDAVIDGSPAALHTIVLAEEPPITPPAQNPRRARSLGRR